MSAPSTHNTVWPLLLLILLRLVLLAFLLLFLLLRLHLLLAQQVQEVAR